jgi:hypothetical protein
MVFYKQCLLKISKVSCIHPIIHFIPNPRPPSDVGLETIGKKYSLQQLFVLPQNSSASLNSFKTDGIQVLPPPYIGFPFPLSRIV